MNDAPPDTSPYDAFSAQALFEELFWRWYKPLEREVRGSSALAPDFERGIKAAASRLPATAQGAVRRQLERMADAARQDQARFLPANGQLGLEWLLAFEEYYTVQEARSMAAMVDGENPNNDFVVLCCELGAAFGALLRAAAPSLVWVPEAPYWESYLHAPDVALRVHPFAAALRFMSTSRTAPLSARYEVLCAEVSAR